MSFVRAVVDTYEAGGNEFGQPPLYERHSPGIGKQPTTRYSAVPDVAEGNLSIELAVRR